MRLGRVAQLVYNAIFGDEGALCAELLPLPPPPPKAEEARLITAVQAGTKPQDLRHDFPRTIKAAGRQAWIFIVIVLINYLHCGYYSEETKLGDLGTVYTPAQRSAHGFLGERVDMFLDTEERMPGVDWPRFLNMKRVDYDDNVVLKACR